MFVDSHCHLDRLKIEQCGGSIASAIDAAKAADVSHILCVCISADNKDAVLDLANTHPNVLASVGVHPSDVSADIPSSIYKDLIQWANHPKVVAIGETGLDYYYTQDSKDVQLSSFIEHLKAAKALELPTIVHTRDAREDTLTCIEQYGCKKSAGVLHCFTESWEMAENALDLNYYISISGIVTFKNAEALREVAKKIPLERLLIETDSPYLAPVPFRGKSNQPQYVRAVAEFLAELRGETLAELALATTNNFFQLFSKAQPFKNLAE